MKTGIEDLTKEQMTFCFDNGYHFEASYLGEDSGVLISLSAKDEVNAAVIVPPDIIRPLSKWLLSTIPKVPRLKKKRKKIRSDRATHLKR